MTMLSLFFTCNERVIFLKFHPDLLKHALQNYVFFLCFINIDLLKSSNISFKCKLRYN